MVKINQPLLPIKAHFFFFMAALGPILPQLSVIGKQIGIEPDVMGIITSILPIMFVLAKPLVGYIADYFTNYRKLVFMTLIIVMSLAFAGLFFIPTSEDSMKIHVDNLEFCSSNLKSFDCSMKSRAKCKLMDESEEFVVHFIGNSTAELCQEAPNSNSTRQGQANCNIVLPFLECLVKSVTFWVYIVILFVGSIGFNVTNSISDAICFDMLGERVNKYGAQRVWGTLGFGSAALLAGFAVNLWTESDVKSFTPALVIMLIFSGFDVLSVSRLNMPQLSSSESIFKDVWGLVKQPAITTFLVFATIAGIIDSFIIYFLFWYVEEVAEATGYKNQIKLIEGCVVAAECLAEIPFFFYGGKIIKKLGYINCMSVCFFFYAMRLFLISCIPNPWFLVFCELFFQGITYALCYTCIVAYASVVAPPGTSATVQGLIAGMDDGLGFSIGSLIGGFAFKRFGGSRSFFYFSLMALGTCVAHVLIRSCLFKGKNYDKDEYEVPKEQIRLESNDIKG